MASGEHTHHVAAATRPEDAAVVTALVESHREFLDFLERRVGDPVLAEEILQDAFVRSLDRLETIRERESAVAWFYRVLRNAVTDHWRRRGSAGRALDSFAAELQGSVEPEGEVRDAVCQCVAYLATTLKPEYATALQRIEIEGVAVKDFAAEAGISANNAAVRVFRAREALRKQVSRSCGTCAAHGCLDCHCGGPAQA
ncbi:MAG: sigma-70 family RNA polymerase sigma factor [Alphaproteobacteria bacterium]|nr:sigma-70 family RNA polymerase sigma factor [Alphaproteobacteria bacterium]